jgi:hypothetical protein
MIIIENVNKENLFNEMMERYPKATQLFCDWVDDYKHRVGWTGFIPKAKFHDLPGEMQIGIWFAFVIERGAEEWLFDLTEFDLAGDICAYFGMLETQFIDD